MSRPPFPSLLYYGAAVASIALAAGARALIDPALGNHLPFVTFFVAVLFTAWYGGFGPFLLAIALGALAADYFFVPPRGSLLIDALQHQVGLALYFFVGISGALFSHAIHVARRRAETSASETERNREWLRVTLSSIGDAVIATDTQGRVMFLNKVAEELTGWDSQDVGQQPLEVVFKIINEHSRGTVENPVQKVLREGKIVGLANHTVLLAKDGRETPIDDSAAPIRDERGNTIGVVLIFRDVTERRRAEVTQRRLAALVESSDDAIVSKSLDGTIMTWNPGAERLYGYKAEEILGKPFSILVPPERASEIQKNAQRLRAGARVEHFEAVRRCKDGRLIDVSVSYSPLKDTDGRLLGTAVITRDISARKRAEEQVRRSERELSDFFESATVGLHWVGPDGIVLRANQAELDLLGYSREEYVGQHIAKFHADEDVICDILHRLEAGEKLREYSARMKCKDGSLKDVLIDSSVLWEDGRFVHTRCFTRDVTEHRRAEEALRASEERFRELIEQAPFSVQIFSPDGRTIRVNRAWEELWGVRFDQIGTYNILEDRQLEERGIDHFIRQAFAGQPAHIPAIQYNPNETIPGVTQDEDPSRWLSAVIYPLKDEDGQVREVVLIHEDITDRRRAETALRESEERFRQLAENIEDVFWMADPKKSQILFISPAYERVWGRTCASLYEDPLSYLEAVHAEDRPRAFAAVERQAQGETTTVEYRILQPDGSVRWVLDRAFPIQDPSGEVYRVAGIAEDVTERKRVEQDLRLQAHVLESMLEGVSVSDENGFIVYTNPAEDRIFGYGRGELVGQHVSVQNTYPPDENERIVGEIIQQLKNEGEWSGEFSNRRKDGSRFITYARITSVEMGERRYFVCVQEDVTERKRVETELHDARSRLDAALEAGAIFTWTWDIPNNRLFADEALARLFDLSPLDVETGLLDKYVKSIHPDDRPRVSAALDHSVESGEEYEADYRIIQTDGSMRWVTARGRVERDETGRAVRMAGVLVEITERKKAEEELRHSERVSRFLAEATTLLNALTEYESTLQQVAELAVPFLGDWCIVDLAKEDGALQRLAMAHEDPEKVKLLQELHHRYPPQSTDPIGPQHVFRTRRPEMASEMADSVLVSAAKDEDHLRILRSLGLRSYISVPLLARGRILGVLTFITASSERSYQPGDLRVAEDLAHRVALAVDNAALYATVQHALREKEESLALLDTLQQNAPVGFGFVDRHFRYLRINEALASIDGNSPEYHLGRTVEETVPALWPDLEPLYRRVLETGDPVTNQEVTGETPATPGQRRHWLVNYYPVRVHGEVMGIGILVTDITERKRLEDELRQQARQLADAARRKDEFLATLAHELRNPLAPISNSLQILKMPNVAAATLQETREMMERQVHHLVRLVDDLLDVSRVMRGKVELRKEPVELATVIARAVETTQSLIAVQGHQFDVVIPPESLLLDADPVRLAQVIGNLLTNSARYTEPNGHIRLTADREGDQAVLRVRDDGVGIAPDMLPHIFDLFVQVENANSRSQGGLGIGLTLVKNLVELHGGTIEAHSAGLGEGSEFVVRLPLLAQAPRPVEDAADQQRQERVSSGHRLLVVDDNEDAARSFALLLRLRGHHVTVAPDGPAALEIMKSSCPDLVFLDIGMPGMDGYEVARRIRTTPGLEKVVLAALTGWGQQEDRRRSAEAGFNHHLVKPPDPVAVEAILAELKRKEI